MMTEPLIATRSDENITHPYWMHYQWQQDPFVELPLESNLIFPFLENQLDVVQHLIHSQNMLLILTGNEGVGKSTFLRLFHVQLTNMEVLSLKGSPLCSPQYLSDALSQHFHVSKPQGATVEEELDHFIAEIQYMEQPCLLIIDDADQLPSETLHTLLDLIHQQSNTQMQLHILLAGTDGLLEKFSGEDYYCIKPISLKALSLEETKQYLTHRLHEVGHQGQLPFEDLMIQHMHQVTGGAPGKINNMARQILADNIPPPISTDSLWEKLKNKLIGAFLMVLLLVGLLFILERRENKIVAKAPAPAFTFAQQKTTPSGASINGKPLEAPVHPAVVQPVIPASKIENVPAPVMEPIKQAQTNAPSVAEKPSAEKPNPADDLFPVQNTVPPPKELKEKPHNKHLRSKIKAQQLPPSHAKRKNYTIQIMGASRKSTIQKLFQKSAHQNMHYYRTTLNGKPWFVLAYGQYASFQEATKAKHHLPPRFKNNDPWVRKIPKP